MRERESLNICPILTCLSLKFKYCMINNNDQLITSHLEFLMLNVDEDD